MSKRELIDTGADKRYVRRDEDRKFKESVDVSRSLSPDARHDAENDRLAKVTKSYQNAEIISAFCQ